jgi:cell wall-associated NlpC family hydrolase
MKPYFANEPRQRQLRTEARSWLGTPFHAHARYLQVGVDCVWLAAELYRALGVLTQPKFPSYAISAGSHLDASKVSKFVDASGAFEPVPPVAANAIAGDLLGFKLGRVIHHVGVVTDPPRFVHAAAGLGVCEASLQDPLWAKRLSAIWRPIEPER